MAKDPAFLFYPGDWTLGTLAFTRHHKGAYMDLLMAQFSLGHLCINQIKNVLGSDFDELWESVLKPKFTQDEKGCFFNERLDVEFNKRRTFTESRRKNLKSIKKDDSHIDDHTDLRMENENENENKDVIKIENTYFKECIEIWFKFYEARTGLKPKTNGGHFKAFKEIVKYFCKNAPDYTPTQCLQAVFDNWDKLDKFYSKFIDIKQINSNLNTILTQINNGTKEGIPTHWQ